MVVAPFEPSAQPPNPSSDADPPTTSTHNKSLPNAIIRFRRSRKGISRVAAKTPPSVPTPGMDSNEAVVVVVVEKVRVVLVTTLLPLKVRLEGAKTHEAPGGSVPQENVTVPE